jgi:hypothetical protein
VAYSNGDRIPASGNSNSGHTGFVPVTFHIRVLLVSV